MSHVGTPEVYTHHKYIAPGLKYKEDCRYQNSSVDIPVPYRLNTIHTAQVSKVQFLITRLQAKLLRHYLTPTTRFYSCC